MQIVSNIESIDSVAWQTLVEQSPTATWFQTEDAYAFYVSVKDSLEPFVFAINRQNALKGVVVGYVTKEHNKIKQRLSKRAIIVGGPLLAQDISDEELMQLLNAVKANLKRKAIYVESRNFCDFGHWRHIFETCGFGYQSHYDIHIDCANRAAMWQRIAESKQRQIRHAQTNSELVSETHNINDIHEWYAQLSHLYKTKVHRPLFPESFFRTAIEHNFCKLLVVKDAQNRVVGGLFGPILSNKALYEWYVCGPILATYGAMEYCTNKFIHLLDTMGAGVPEVPYGVRDFKLQMGGTLHEYGRFVLKNDLLRYYLGKLVVKLLM